MNNYIKGTSLYYIVKNTIHDRIQKGIYKVESQLPTESELCEEFEVSRVTIRSALQNLELEGKIHKIQGKGSFVSRPKINEKITSSIKSFSEQMKSAGLESYSKVLEKKLIPASIPLAHSLDIQENDPVILLIRLRYANNESYQYSTSYIPWKVAPNLMDDDCSGSLFDLLINRYNLSIYKSNESIKPIIPEKEISNKLDITYSTPAFLLTSYTYAIDNSIVEYSTTIVRGDIGTFETERFYNY